MPDSLFIVWIVYYHSKEMHSRVFFGFSVYFLIWNYFLMFLIVKSSANLGRAACEVEFYYLNTALNQSMSDQKCRLRGYDGLAILEDEDHIMYAHDVVYLNNYNHSSNNIWFGLEYKEVINDFGWSENGLWSSYPTINHWALNEPDNIHLNQICVRMKFDKTFESSVLWGTWWCDKNIHALCQKERTSSNKMRLKRKSVAPPANSYITKTSSLLKCCILCMSTCTCRAVHFSNGDCRLLTYKLLLSSDVIVEISGNIYVKHE